MQSKKIKRVTFNKEIRDQVWKRAISIPGSTELIKQDAYGNIMHYEDYGKLESLYSWEIDHIVPFAFLKANGVLDNNIGNYQAIKKSTNNISSDNMLYKKFIYTQEFINYQKHIYNIQLVGQIGTFVPSFTQLVNVSNFEFDNRSLMEYEKKLNGGLLKFGSKKYFGDNIAMDAIDTNNDLKSFLLKMLGETYEYIEKNYWITTSKQILFKIVVDKYKIEDIKHDFIIFSKMMQNAKEFIIYDMKKKQVMKHVL